MITAEAFIPLSEERWKAEMALYEHPAVTCKHDWWVQAWVGSFEIPSSRTVKYRCSRCGDTKVVTEDWGR